MRKNKAENDNLGNAIIEFGRSRDLIEDEDRCQQIKSYLAIPKIEKASSKKHFYGKGYLKNCHF